jgi:hypothetical protein
MSASPLPPYVDPGGLQVLCQPGLSLGVRFYTFLLDADQKALQAVCDRFLNGPTGGAVRFRPVLPRVLLAFAAIERLKSMVPPYRDWGWIPESDAVLCIPVVETDDQSPIPERLAWFVPYIVVDSAWACIAGREIYGFPKEVGTFRIPKDHADQALWSVDTMVFEQFSPQTQGSNRRLIEVRRVDRPTVDGPSGVIQDLEEAFRDILDVLDGGSGLNLKDLKLDWQIVDDLRHLRVPFLFLKQFRDVANGQLACYQAVIEAPMLQRNVKIHGPLPGRYQVAFGRYASHPIITDLGLAGAGVEPVATLYTEYDFVMAPGREVWKA